MDLIVSTALEAARPQPRGGPHSGPPEVRESFPSLVRERLSRRSPEGEQPAPEEETAQADPNPNAAALAGVVLAAAVQPQAAVETPAALTVEPGGEPDGAAFLPASPVGAAPLTAGETTLEAAPQPAAAADGPTPQLVEPQPVEAAQPAVQALAAAEPHAEVEPTGPAGQAAVRKPPQVEQPTAAPDGPEAPARPAAPAASFQPETPVEHFEQVVVRPQSSAESGAAGQKPEPNQAEDAASGPEAGQAVQHPTVVRTAPMQAEEALQSLESRPVREIPWLSQVQEGVKILARSGESQLHLQLQPQEMGTIDLHILSREDGVSVVILADQADTAQLLERQLQDLKQALQRSGIDLQNLSVDQQGSHSSQHNPQPFLPGGRKASHASQPADRVESPNIRRMAADSASALDYRI